MKHELLRMYYNCPVKPLTDFLEHSGFEKQETEMEKNGDSYYTWILRGNNYEILIAPKTDYTELFGEIYGVDNITGMRTWFLYFDIYEFRDIVNILRFHEQMNPKPLSLN